MAVAASQWQRRKRVWSRPREQRYTWEWRRQERLCALSLGEEDSGKEGKEEGERDSWSSKDEEQLSSPLL